MAADFLTPKVENTKTKSTQSSAKISTNSDTKSDKPSLFDNILKTVQEETKSNEKVTAKDISSKKTIKNGKKIATSKDISSKKATSSKTVISNNTKQDVKTTSLLDKMIIDAKTTLNSTKKVSSNSTTIKKTTDEKISPNINNKKDHNVQSTITKAPKDKLEVTIKTAESKDSIKDDKKVTIKTTKLQDSIKKDKKVTIKTVKLEEMVKENGKKQTNIKNEDIDKSDTHKDIKISIKQDIEQTSTKSLISKKKTVSTNTQTISKDKIDTKHELKSDIKLQNNQQPTIEKENVIKEKKQVANKKKSKSSVVKESSISNKIVKNKPQVSSKDEKTIKVINSNEQNNETLTIKDIDIQSDIVLNDDMILDDVDIKAQNNIKKTSKISKNKLEQPIIKSHIEPKPKDNITVQDDNMQDIDDTLVSKVGTLDSLVSNTVNNIIDDLPKDKLTKTKVVLNSISSNDTMQKQNDNKTILANIFLGTQKSSDSFNKIQTISEAKEILKEDKSTKGLKKSAKKLNLNLTDVKVEQTKVETKDVSVAQQTQIKSINQFLDKLILNPNNNIQQNNPSLNATVFPVASKEIQKVQESSSQLSQNAKSEDTTVQVNVPSSVVQAFTTKVIGARQQVSSFMSDLSRSMYQNYKPPVTAFRLKLNPDNLGNISVVLKSNKADKTMSVSMNMSNSTTLDAFIDNKAMLHSALQKTFTENASTVSLNFGMQSESSNQSFEQSKQEQQQFVVSDTQVEVSQAEDDDIAPPQDYM